MNTRRLTRLFLIFTAILTHYGQISAQEAEKKVKTVITSKEMVSENDKGMMRFSGNVELIHGDLYMKSDEMEVYSDETKKKLIKIIATGNVLITKGERVISCDKAELFADEEKIIMTGNPEVTEKGNRIAGEKIIYFYAKEGIIVHGGNEKKASVLIVPSEESESTDER